MEVPLARPVLYIIEELFDWGRLHLNPINTLFIIFSGFTHLEGFVNNGYNYSWTITPTQIVHIENVSLNPEQ